MKTMRFLRCELLAMLLLMTQFAWSTDIEKRKIIEKSYAVGPSDRLEIENQFGKLHVNTWDKQEIKVRVEIVAVGRNDERTQRILDRIDVGIIETAEMIAFETSFGTSMNSGNGESFEVNYTVYMPAVNPASFHNKFGDIYLDRRVGETEVELEYGSLKTEDILGTVEIEIGFGSGELNNLKEAKVEVKYSELRIESGAFIDMESQFSDVRLGRVGELQLESKYGDIEIAVADKIDADSQFSGFSVGRLNERIYLEGNYVSDFEIEVLSRTFERVELYGKFSSFEISMESGLKADLEAAFSFSDLKTDADVIDFYYRSREDTRREYKGKINGGDPHRKIIVKSSYGDLRIQ